MQYSRLCPVLSSSSFNYYVSRRLISSETVELKQNAPLKSWKEIPGPSSFPFIGVLHHVLPGGSLYNLNGLELTKKLNKGYGPIVRLAGFFTLPPIVMLFDAEASAHILRGENWLPLRPGFKSLQYYRHNYKKNVNPKKLTGLITDHGEAWKEFRSTVNPVLLQPKTIKLYASVLDEVALDMIARLRSMRDENNQLQGQIDQEMKLWSLESIGVVALGCRLNCLDPNLPEDSPARKLIQMIHDFFTIANEIDFKPNLSSLFATPKFKKAMKLYEEEEKLTKYFVDQAVVELKKKTKSDDEKGVLEKLLEINEEFAYIMASDMLFAGVDTTSNSIIATLYLLAKNPEKQEKLRAELLSNEEKKPYLKAILKESLRMLPVVTANLRVTTKEYEVLGYKIPSNMYVVFSHQNMSLMEKNFPRPNEFIPERWISEKDDPLHYRSAHPFAYNPFGFGVRSCVGRRIAELELETFLARLIENFHVDWVGPPIKVEATSLNNLVGPFHFVFKDVAKLKSIRDENNQLRRQLDQEIEQWSLESIVVVVLGCRLNCLDPNLPEDSPVGRLIQTIRELSPPTIMD